VRARKDSMLPGQGENGTTNCERCLSRAENGEVTPVADGNGVQQTSDNEKQPGRTENREIG
jgi:hypothetical protein